MEGKGLFNPLTQPAAWATSRMILRSLRKHFRAVYLSERDRPDPAQSTIVFANHHYWWDGYLVHLLRCHWRLEAGFVWMRDWRAFPPFGTLGAMPFPDDDVKARVRTIRRTLRLMRTAPSTLSIFPEGDLHPAPVLLPFNRALLWLHRQLPEVPLLPLAIEIVPGIQQYPEVFLRTGEFFSCAENDEQAWLNGAAEAVENLLGDLVLLREKSPDTFERILQGRPSISEPWRCSRRGPT